MSYIGLVITYIFVSNYILVQFLGLCAFIGVSKNSESAFGMGMAVTFVTSVTSVVCYIIYHLVLAPLHIEYLQTVAFILVIASLVSALEMFIRKSSPSLYKALGIYLPLITTNCLVLGIALINITSKHNLLETFVSGLSAGLGFTLAIVLMSAIREKLELQNIPRSFKGVPIAFISAALMALAFMGFDKGLITNLGLV